MIPLLKMDMPARVTVTVLPGTAATVFAVMRVSAVITPLIV
jgi:hypothetical protein